jgi:hypothetical protein
MNTATSYVEKLQKGDYTKITNMLGGKYARATVEAQLKGWRTLKPDVEAAANLYIQTIEALYQPKQPELA